MKCPTCCREGWDPKADLRERIAREDAFCAAWRRIHCPACRKRISPEMDNVDAGGDQPTVRMVCRHCAHRFELPRRPAAA